jgi:tetratricopeptide (TPR) repeat protein
MQIVLRSSSRKAFWKSISLLSVLAYTGIVLRDYVAYRLADSQSIHAMEQAVTLDPSNADYRNRLGEYFMFSEQRPDLAIPQYESAVTLNAHAAAYWLDLANALASTGASDQQERALERALEVDPNTPWVSRQAAYAFLIRGDLQRSFKIFRLLLQTDPWQMESTLQICWQATHNIDSMSDMLPPAPDVYLAFVKLLIGEGNTEGAETIWSRLVTLQQPFDPQLATPYIENLFAQRDVGAAKKAWNELAHIDPDFRPYQPTASNLVVNGGFEEKLLNMGFDWRYEDRPHVTLVTDVDQFHGGRRSLLVTFDGGAVVDSGLSQWIAVEPNTRYDFSAYVKADNIYTADGPRFDIQDAYSKDSLLLTQEILGTTDWKNVGGSFKTGPNTGVVLLSVMRTPGAGLITGRLWIDDVVLMRE